MRVVILRELYLCLFVQMTVSQIKYHCLSEENGCGYLGNHQRISAKSSPALWLSDSEPLRLSCDSSPDQLRSATRCRLRIGSGMFVEQCLILVHSPYLQTKFSTFAKIEVL